MTIAPTPAILSTVFGFALSAGAAAHAGAAGPPGGAVPFAVQAAAHPEGPGPHGRRGFHGAPGKRLDKICSIAGCTKAQRAKIQRTFERTRTTTEADRKKLRKLHEAMRAEWKKDRLDRAKIRELAAKIHETKGRIARARVEARMDVHAILSKEQREKLAKARRRHHKGKHGKRRHHKKQGAAADGTF